MRSPTHLSKTLEKPAVPLESTNVKTKGGGAGPAHPLADILHFERFACYIQKFSPLTEKANALPVHREALVRLITHNGAVIMPEPFIRHCESEGVVMVVDIWMANRIARHLERDPLGDSIYALNVSRLSATNPVFITRLKETIARHNIKASRLCLEITETAYTAELQAMIDFVKAAQDLGISVSLDDVGAGATSVLNLRKLEVNYIKFDREFTKAATEKDRDSSLLQAIQTFAAKNGIHTVGEGVETQEQYDYLRAAGVDYIQGYLIERPNPLH